MRDTTRFRELDALRGIAALWVVLYHYLTRYDQIFHGTEPSLLDHFVFPNGLYAVYLFFMISGFVIFMTLRHCNGAADFITSRFSRLYPAYWAALAATTAIYFLAPLPYQDFSLGQILINTTMLQQYFLVEHVDGVYWSLTHELGFYAIMLALFLAGMIRRIETACWAWLALAVTGTVATRYGVPMLYRVGMALDFSYAQYFIAGIVFYLARHEGYTRNRVLLLAACLGAAISADPYYDAIGVAFLFFIVFHLCITGRLRKLAASRVLHWLGAISYPLYLTHQMIGYRFIASLLEHNVPAPVVIVAAIAGALAFATLLSRTIERPAMRLIRQAYHRYAAARIAAY